MTKAHQECPYPHHVEADHWRGCPGSMTGWTRWQRWCERSRWQNMIGQALPPLAWLVGLAIVIALFGWAYS